MDPKPKTTQTLLAFAIIYLVWGSTFLAIRIGVHEIPPFLLAALRFLLAGAALYAFMRVKGQPPPSRRQWTSILLIAFLIFVLDYGLLFWAEQRVPSGIAAVMMATIPAFTALAEILFLRTQRLTPRLTFALLIGLAGVAVLTTPSLGTTNLGAPAIDTIGALTLLLAAISWSLASILSRKLPLPPSKVINSGAQMLVGGLLLALASAALGEWRQFHPQSVSPAAWLSLLYLILFGSILGFTAYVWLSHHQSPTKVGTYAYVNPVVAVLLGYLLGNESLGLRSILGAACVLIGVVTISTTKPASRAAQSTPLPPAAE